MKPQDLLYAETHEWVRVADENGVQVATVGITDFAVKQLTDLVFISLPKVGATVSPGAEFGEVESVKAVSPLYSPIAGEVIAVNTQLAEKLETLSSDAYGAGWMIRVRVTDPSGLSKLMDRAAYERQCAESGQ